MGLRLVRGCLPWMCGQFKPIQADDRSFILGCGMRFESRIAHVASSNEVPKSSALGLEVALVVRIGLHADGNLLGDFESVAFESDNLLRIVGEQANGFEAEVHEDL